MTGVACVAFVARTCRRTSIPLMPGMRTSRTTRSKPPCASDCSACSPVATPTTSKPLAENATRNNWRTCWSSSTTKIRPASNVEGESVPSIGRPSSPPVHRDDVDKLPQRIDKLAIWEHRTREHGRGDRTEPRTPLCEHPNQLDLRVDAELAVDRAQVVSN